MQALSEAAERVEKSQPASRHHVALLACPDGLPQNSRKLISLRYDTKRGDADQLARRFGFTVQSVYARIKRLNALLRDCVEKRLSRGVIGNNVLFQGGSRGQFQQSMKQHP